MTDDDRAGAELVAVRATRRRVGDPLPGRGLHQLAQHNYKPMPRATRAGLANSAVPVRLTAFGVNRPATWVDLATLARCQPNPLGRTAFMVRRAIEARIVVGSVVVVAAD